ncbi:hypothetical protein HY449_03865 [Candidatus Pacearchaeota archaeon]|nr:hypothetical protein [Candidatus Pacearchaeota archaeon]
MSIRRIIERNEEYQVLKPDKGGAWNFYGRHIKNIRGVYNFLRNLDSKSEEDIIEIDSETQNALEKYESTCKFFENAPFKRASKVI